MKRYGELYEKIYDYDNLMLAYENARKNKTHYTEVKEIDKNPEEYLIQLQNMLIWKTYKTSEYEIFSKIDKGKEREIYKLPFFPDRILHHALANIIGPILCNSLINDTYASIKGKGIHYGVERIRKALNDEENTQYCLKLDIKKYYPSINHDILKQLLRKKFKDKDLLWLIDEIIDSVPEKQGLPIDNYLSQIFGAFYLSYFEHWLKHEKKIKHLFVYCDDIVILHKDKEFLHGLFMEIKEYLSLNLDLQIKGNHQIFPVDIRGIDFLGYRFFRDYTLLRKRTTKTFKRKMRKLLKRCQKGIEMTYSEWCSINSYKGWIMWCNGYNLTLKYIKPLLPYAEKYYKDKIKNKKRV